MQVLSEVTKKHTIFEGGLQYSPTPWCSYGSPICSCKTQHPPPPETRPAHGLHDSLPELNYVPPPELIQCISTLLMQYRIIHTFIFSSNNSTLKQLNTLPSQNAFKTAVVIISASYFTCAIISTETIFYMYPVGKLLLFVLVALST